MQLRLPGMKDARSPIKKIGKTRARLIGWLLHNANSSPPMIGRNEFYELKQRILITYGTPGEVEYQHFEKKDCFHCWTYHHCWDCDDFGHCCRCDGTGVYLPEVWVKVTTWELGGFRFHSPDGKLYELPEGCETKYEGKIVHEFKPYHLPEECQRWLELFFDTHRFFSNLGRNAYYGRYDIKRPLVSLGTLVALFRFDRWRLLRNLLPHRLYFWLRHRQEIESPEDIPF